MLLISLCEFPYINRQSSSNTVVAMVGAVRLGTTFLFSKIGEIFEVVLHCIAIIGKH